MTPTEAEVITRCLTRDITYSNFKSTVTQQPDQAAELTGLHDIWEIHHDWQIACNEIGPTPLPY